MNRTQNIVFLTAIFAVLSLVACRKPNNSRTTNDPYVPVNPNGQPPVNYPGSGAASATLKSLFNDLRSTPQTLTTTAGVSSTLYGTKGTRITFYPNSFKDASGNIITSGTIVIKLTEMLTPGAMIAENATTQTTTGDILRSGGQVKIEASKDGQAVYANKYSLSFKQPAASYQPMDLYFGDRNNNDSAVLWRPLDTASTGGTGTTATGTTTDSTTGGGGGTGGFSTPFYVFDSCTDFIYVNCDKLNSIPGPRTNIHFVMPDTTFNANNSTIYLIFNDINSVATVRRESYETSTKSFNLKYYTLPIGYTMTVITLCKKADGKYYFSEQNGLTITDAMSVNVTMTERTLDFIKTRLGEL